MERPIAIAYQFSDKRQHNKTEQNNIINKRVALNKFQYFFKSFNR